MAASWHDEVIGKLVDFVTANGSDAADALRAELYEVSKGAVGSPAKGTELKEGK